MKAAHFQRKFGHTISLPAGMSNDYTSTSRARRAEIKGALASQAIR